MFGGGDSLGESNILGRDRITPPLLLCAPEKGLSELESIGGGGEGRLQFIHSFVTFRHRLQSIVTIVLWRARYQIVPFWEKQSRLVERDWTMAEGYCCSTNIGSTQRAKKK